MFTVLLGLDWAPSATRSLDFTRDSLGDNDVAVTILHVIPRHMIYGCAGVPLKVDELCKESAASRALLRDCAEYLQTGGKGSVIERQLVMGDPADLILAAAEE